MKIDRLLSIIMILLERKKISAVKLAEMFEVTTRTIYRDIDTINQAGIPVVAYPGVNGGISIMEDYKIGKKFFTASDIITLLIGLGSISKALTGNELVTALTKVKSLIPEDQFKDIELKSNQIAVDLTAWAGNKHLQKNIEIIKRALNENRYLHFHYFDGQGNSSERKVEPYQLVLKATHWYLQAYCLHRQDFRVFKLIRISELTWEDELFIPRDFTPNPMDGSGWIDKRMITITLLIDKSLREQILEYCSEENISPHGENSYLVTMPFPQDEHSYNLLLSYGDKCECLEPIHVRREIIHRIEKLLHKYR